MTRMFTLFFCLSIVFSVTGCWRKDVRLHTVHVPELENLKEAALIEKSLKKTNLATPQRDGTPPFYGEFEIDLSEKTLVIEYNARLHSHKNIEHEIAKLGYTANDVPGDTNALQRTRALLVKE